MARSLDRLEVLVVDCQTTGASPQRGHVVEVAWSRGRAGDGGWRRQPRVASALVRLPDGGRLPPRIATLTGIAPGQLVGAPPPEEVWRRLGGEIRRLATTSEDGRAPGVAHFARFERGFLEAWHRDLGPGRRPALPLELLCTHEIACRLLPGLPSRGLRAVAGYLGHVMGGEKRAAAHVRATVAVWTELVDRLREEAGVTTLDELRRWREEVAPARRAGREFAVARTARLRLPDAPGVYRMLGRGGEVLYVGKATSLHRRVNSYFQHRHRRPGGDRTLEMLTQVWGVDVTPCASPLEAAVREADEIKEHAPPYNVALRGRDPAAFFASPDLAEVRPSADDAHRVGPLPRRDSLAAVPALRSLLADEGSAPHDDVWLAALGMGAPVPGENGRLDRRRLDPTGLREGFWLFRERAGWIDRTELSAPELLRVGARFWREHLAEHRERDDEDDAPLPDEEERPRDPQEVARWFGLTLGRCAQLVRRGRWFERLCESSLWWRPRAGETHLLRVERGEVVVAEADPPDARAPVPRAAARPAHERRRCFDAAVYDRLRVLTTELRRLVAERAELELRLGPGPGLDRAALARRLGGV